MVKEYNNNDKLISKKEYLYEEKIGKGKEYDSKVRLIGLYI